jgi:hypothetical protein
LVLDDVLVNFDTIRATSAAKVLRDFAALGNQVVMFTCHEHIMRLFDSIGVQVRVLPTQGEPGIAEIYHPQKLISGVVIDQAPAIAQPEAAATSVTPEQAAPIVLERAPEPEVIEILQPDPLVLPGKTRVAAKVELPPIKLSAVKVVNVAEVERDDVPLWFEQEFNPAADELSQDANAQSDSADLPWGSGYRNVEDIERALDLMQDDQSNLRIESEHVATKHGNAVPNPSSSIDGPTTSMDGWWEHFAAQS